MTLAADDLLALADPCDGWPWRWPGRTCPALWAAANHGPSPVPTMEGFDPRDVTPDRPALFRFLLHVDTDRHHWPHSTDWTLESGPDDAPSSVDIVVPYSYRGATADSWTSYGGQPGDSAEVETGVPWFVQDGARCEVNLTAAELERVETWIYENPPEPDYGDDW